METNKLRKAMRSNLPTLWNKKARQEIYNGYYKYRRLSKIIELENRYAVLGTDVYLDSIIDKAKVISKHYQKNSSYILPVDLEIVRKPENLYSSIISAETYQIRHDLSQLYCLKGDYDTALKYLKLNSKQYNNGCVDELEAIIKRILSIREKLHSFNKGKIIEDIENASSIFADYLIGFIYYKPWMYMEFFIYILVDEISRLEKKIIDDISKIDNYIQIKVFLELIAANQLELCLENLGEHYDDMFISDLKMIKEFLNQGKANSFYYSFFSKLGYNRSFY